MKEVKAWAVFFMGKLLPYTVSIYSAEDATQLWYENRIDKYAELDEKFHAVKPITITWEV